MNGGKNIGHFDGFLGSRYTRFEPCFLTWTSFLTARNRASSSGRSSQRLNSLGGRRPFSLTDMPLAPQVSRRYQGFYFVQYGL
jgi:hypothetical protein